MTKTESWKRSVRLPIAAVVVAMLSVVPASLARAQNLFLGSGAGAANTTGTNNSAFGSEALSDNTTGDNNTAVGFEALMLSPTSEGSTAVGSFALSHDISVNGENTATGWSALRFNTTGVGNTATGQEALLSNTTGFDNTAMGEGVLEFNNGSGNTATGATAMASNSTGANNTATGVAALMFNSTGSDNTAIGGSALGSASFAGSSNIAIGEIAGDKLTSGDDNIDIGNEGVAGEANTIRIGTTGMQTSTFIAGISNTPMHKSSARAVLIDSSGQLGFQSSSARFKRDIRDMGDASAGLMELRPVSFRYKQDPNGSVQYGLIAEEVQRSYPELVTYGADGRVDGVRYDLLPAMLINEMQKLARDKNAQISVLRRQVALQQKQLDTLKKRDAQIDALTERMNAIESQARLSKPQALADATR
jgi:hypothetical protein